ncbi:MAG: hypothetical protein ACRELY_15795, partial [Polyangiaceae bacterium]
MAAEDRENPARSASQTLPWRERAFTLAVSLGTFAASVAHARSTSDATHDEAIVRVLGFGFVGAWRELDALIAFPFVVFAGPRSMHCAELASAIGAAIAAAVLYRLTRNLLDRCGSTSSSSKGGSSTWLGPFVAAIATWAAVLGTAWQCEAASPGGATWGALLTFVFPLLLAQNYVQYARFGLGALACGLALSYEPLLGASAIASAATLLAMTRTRPAKRDLLQAVPAFVLGVAAPIAFGISRRSVSPLSLPLASPLSGWLGTTQPTTHGD